ncbi:MAG: 6-carboxytetrahydropterin synthase [Pseudomonadota bacterium]
MYAVEVRDHIMIAHSFTGAFFGPAQAVHGATFIIDACFFSETLDENNVVIDIGAAHKALKSVLEPINYKNLDDVEKFSGINTTTEFLTKYVFDELAVIARNGGLGRASGELSSLRITISESHVARATYEAAL